jgi:hypothetical protein
MFSLSSLLLAIHLGSLTGPVAPVISLRDDSFATSTQTVVARSVLFDSDRVFGPAGHAPEWFVSKGSALPLFQVYRPEEWITSMAHEFHAEDARITRAALFLASAPLQINVTRNRVYLALRVQTF